MATRNPTGDPGTQPAAQPRNLFKEAGDWAWNTFVKPPLDMFGNVTNALLEPIGGGRVGPAVGHSPAEAASRDAMIREFQAQGINLGPYQNSFLDWLAQNPDAGPTEVYSLLGQIQQASENKAAKDRYLAGFDQAVAGLKLDDQIQNLEGVMKNGDYLGINELKQGFDLMNTSLIAGQQSEENTAAATAAATGVRDSGFAKDQLRRSRDSADATRGTYMASLPTYAKNEWGRLTEQRSGLQRERAGIEGTPDDKWVQPPDFSAFTASNRNQAIGGNQFGLGLAANVFGPAFNPATYIQGAQIPLQAFQNTLGMMMPRRFGGG